MFRIIPAMIFVSLSIAPTNWASAECASCDDECAACESHVSTACPAPQCQAAGHCGGARCIGKAKLVDKEKHCWKIDCRDKCVPAVRFPWEPGGSKITLLSLFRRCRAADGHSNPNCCDAACNEGCTGGCNDECTSRCADCVAPTCGFIVKVRNLKKETFTEQVCEYSIELAESDSKPRYFAECTDGCTSCGQPPLRTKGASYKVSPIQTKAHAIAPNAELETSVPALRAVPQPQNAPTPSPTLWRPHQPSLETPITTHPSAGVQSRRKSKFALISQRMSDSMRATKGNVLTAFKARTKESDLPSTVEDEASMVIPQ